MPEKYFYKYIIERKKHKCKECINARKRELYANNPKKYHQYFYKYRSTEKGRLNRLEFTSRPEQRQKQHEWAAKYRETGRAKEIFEKRKNELDLSYISQASRMKVADLTPEIISIKRKQIKLVRKVKELRNPTNYKNQ